MKKLRILVTTLCLLATLAFAVPATTYADDSGPQGTGNSAPKPPPPPPPTLTQQIIWALFKLI